MPKLKALSGSDVVKILETFGFFVAGQKGSHIKMARAVTDGQRQILTIPNHKELDKGTAKAIFNQASRFIDRAELFKHFYS